MNVLSKLNHFQSFARTNSKKSIHFPPKFCGANRGCQLECNCQIMKTYGRSGFQWFPLPIASPQVSKAGFHYGLYGLLGVCGHAPLWHLLLQGKWSKMLLHDCRALVL